MKVQEVAKHLGVTPDTVRYYVRIGVASPERDPANGYRRFGRRDLTNLRFCIHARQLGFSLDEILEILGQAHHGNTPCPRVREIVGARMQDIERQFAEMQQLYERIQRAAKAWETMPDGEPTSHMVCHLVETWEQDLTTESAAS